MSPRALPEKRTLELTVAAYERIAKGGFERLRTRDVANDAGVNVATLHYYFPTKEKLIEAVVGYAMGRFRTIRRRRPVPRHDATFGGSVYSAGSFGTNNGPHEPTVDFYETDASGRLCPGPIPNRVDLGGSSNSLNFIWSGPDGPTNFNVPSQRMFDGQAPVTTGPVFTRVADAQSTATGHWMPGTYAGIYPSGGLLDPGVYVIKNVTTTMTLGVIANAIPVPRGVADPTGPIAIVLDASDTGSFDMSDAVLNGLDDLGGAAAPPPRDPLGTHNFVIYASGYAGGFSLGPHSVSDLSGLLYAPDSFLNTNGNASPVFTGSAMFAGITTVGGGNGLPRYNWICGPGSIKGSNQPGSPAALQR